MHSWCTVYTCLSVTGWQADGTGLHGLQTSLRLSHAHLSLVIELWLNCVHLRPRHFLNIQW